MSRKVTVSISVRLPQDAAAYIDRYAEADGMAPSVWMRHQIEAALRRRIQEEAPTDARPQATR